MNTKYIFIADGELKVFLSELIAQQFCTDGEHHFFTFTPKIEETWDLFPWTSRTLLPWVHKKGVFKKYWNLRQRLHHILDTMGNACEGADRIVIHTYQIFSERVNYLFNYLKWRFPKASVHVRLIPDGTLNLTRRPMGIRKLSQLINRAKWIGDPKLKAYFYSGDRLGADAAICDRIYLPKGFPNEYDPAKVHWIEMPDKRAAGGSGTGKKALVVGTALTQTGVCSRDDVDRTAAAMARRMQEIGVTEAYYKMHHKEKRDELELWSPACEMFETSRGIERILLEEQFDVLIGMCSTSLLTSKLMFQDLQVISCGLDVVEKRARRGSSVFKYRGVCESLGIELTPALTEPLPNWNAQPRRRAA